MSWLFDLPFAAAAASLLLAIICIVRKRPTPAAWAFSAGMVALAADAAFTGMALRAIPLDDVVYWVTWSAFAKSLIPVTWMIFTLTYSRRAYKEHLARWKLPLALAAVVPAGIAVLYRNDLVVVTPPGAPDDVWRIAPGSMATPLNVALLVGVVLVLANIEQTFRSAVGTTRWRIKFVVLALAVIFGARLYVRAQAILFSSPDIALWSVEAGALLIGCTFLAVAYLRDGFAELDLYPSSAVLRSSVTVLIVGGYLLVVGVLAQVVRRFGGEEIFQLQAVVVLVGMAALAVLLLSDRARVGIRVFVARHFSRARHDSLQLWRSFSERLGQVRDESSLSETAARLFSETFEVLSIGVWLVDDENGRLALATSTAQQTRAFDQTTHSPAIPFVAVEGLARHRVPFELDDLDEEWAAEFRGLNVAIFPQGGRRLCVPLCTADHMFGAIVLADRVRGSVYTFEELELLRCMGEQVTSVLMNLRLANELARTRELDAFRTMSTFFVHDLKNAASSLNLMLGNLRAHFNDPAFREDALRGLGNTAQRIEEMIGRLSALRHRAEVRVAADLNQLVTEALDGIDGIPGIQLSRELQPVPTILADGEQIRSVVTNLVLNARDAVGGKGVIRICTERIEGRAVLAVSDDGCGMSEAFVRDSLFRPFQSTKKKGLGIGLFQCRGIIRAHGGGIHVDSTPGSGTTFRVSLPASAER